MDSFAATLVESKVPPKPVTNRPILIDPQDGPCELCLAHVSGQCDSCGRGGFNSHLPHEMGESGYQSPRPTHYHLEPVGDIMGRRAYWQELCLECYRAAYQQAYDTEAPL